MKRFSIRLVSLARPVFLATTAVLLVAVVYLYKLGSLTTGVDVAEASIMQQLQTNGLRFADLFRNSINVPYDAGIYIMQFLPFDHAGAVRILSASIALLAIGGLFLIVQHWHTTRVAALGSALFAGSGWLLHIGRHGSPEILYVMPLIILGIYAWYTSHKRSALAGVTLAAALASCIYIPGLSLLLVLLILWRIKDIQTAIARAPATQITAALVACTLVLAPLLTSLVWRTDGESAASFLLTLGGLPSQLPALSDYWHHFIDIPQQLFIMTGNTASWLSIASLPLLDVFTSAMMLLGLYTYAHDWRLDRSKALIVGTIVGWLLVALDGPVAISILLPFVYLYAVEGIRYMLSAWLDIFPRNPLARTVSLSLLTVAVTLAVLFHTISYFRLWPHLARTKAQFSGQLEPTHVQDAQP